MSPAQRLRSNDCDWTARTQGGNKSTTKAEAQANASATNARVVTMHVVDHNVGEGGVVGAASKSVHGRTWATVRPAP